ncbi:MFS transporter [Saccharopolyspora karakumensis]|nr:MFS transporter [Saccharopolyspora karakumensis]
MPLLCAAVFVSFLDRANIGVVAESLQADLHLSAEAFGFAVGIFYLGYVFLQVPSNVALHRFGGRTWIARIVISFGLVSILSAFVQEAWHFYVARAILGAAEAGLIPGVLLYITYWYPRRVRSRPYSVYQLTEPVALGVGSIVTALLLAGFNSVGTESSWRWVFVAEGLLAVAVGVAIIAALPDRPAKARWLSEGDRAYLAGRVELDLAEPDEEVASLGEGRKLLKALTSGSAWYLSLMFFCVIVGFWTITYYLPQIVADDFGSGEVASGLISAIPWTVSLGAILAVGRSTRVFGHRRAHLVGCLFAAALGLCTAASADNGWIALLAVCVSCAGLEAAFPLFYQYQTEMFFGIMAAAVLALVNSVGNIGGFFGPYVYGALTDVTGDGRAGLLLMGSLLVIAAGMALFIERLPAFRSTSATGRAEPVVREKLPPARGSCRS